MTAMRTTTRPILLLLAFGALAAAGVRAQDAAPRAAADDARVEADAATIAQIALHVHDAYECFQWQRARWTDRTDEDVFRAIKLIVDRYAATTNYYESLSRVNAVAFLAELSSTNAYALAEHLARTEPERETWGPRGPIFLTAIGAAAIAMPPLAFRDPANLPSFAAYLDGPDSHRGHIRDVIYRQTDRLVRLEREPGPARTRLLRFLLDRAALETDCCDVLDETLCREIPAWRRSPQRAAVAERLLPGLPADSRARTFFEGVLAEVPESARRAIPDLDPYDPYAPFFRGD